MRSAGIRLMHLLPKSAISRGVGSLVRAPWPAPIRRASIRAFVRLFDIELDEVDGQIEGFESFGAFFTRRLKAGARSVATGGDVLVSPCDGTLGVVGKIEAGTLLQAKGRSYTLEAFLGGAEEARRFEGGTFITIYLSPRNYHRVHLPFDGSIEGAVHIPGTLWPVGPTTLGAIDGVFVANERLVTFETCAPGPAAVVMVGATCVGRIRASYDDIVTNAGYLCSRRRYQPQLPCTKGEELGVFEMGSTVVMLLGGRPPSFVPELSAGQAIEMGQALGVWR